MDLPANYASRRDSNNLLILLNEHPSVAILNREKPATHVWVFPIGQRYYLRAKVNQIRKIRTAPASAICRSSGRCPARIA